ANACAVAALWATIIAKHEPATGRRASASLQVTFGRPIDGSPPGTGPMTATPFSEKWNVALATMLATTANNEYGNRGKTRLPIRMLPATNTDNATTATLDCDRCCKTSQP